MKDYELQVTVYVTFCQQIGDRRAGRQREARVTRGVWTGNCDGSSEGSAGGHHKSHLFLWSHAKPRDCRVAGLQVAACGTTRDPLQTLQPPSKCSWILLFWPKQLLHQLSERGKDNCWPLFLCLWDIILDRQLSETDDTYSQYCTVVFFQLQRLTLSNSEIRCNMSYMQTLWKIFWMRHIVTTHLVRWIFRFS